MKNKYTTYRDKIWTVMSFPKRNVSILWNATDKEYSFHKGVPAEKVVSPVSKKPSEKTIDRWQLIAMCLATGLGIVLSTLLFVLWLVV